MMSLSLIAFSCLISPACTPAHGAAIMGMDSLQAVADQDAGAAQDNPPAAKPTDKATDDGEGPALDILELGFNDCLSRAERLEKMVVVFWTGTSKARNEQMRESVLEDPEVRRWIAKHAIIDRIDTTTNESDAHMNRIGFLHVPSIDIYSVQRGLRLERLFYGSESLDFLAAVLGQTDGEVIERPEGDSINEPFKWLAWANVRYQQADIQAPEDSLFAYQWCLQTADAIRPGFRARFLEYILRRMSGLNGRTPGASEALLQERDRLKKRIAQRKATRRDVYEYTRLVEWLGKEEVIIPVFEQLDSTDAKDRQIQLWLLPAAAPVLGRYRNFGSLLAAVGEDATEIFLARSRSLDAEAARINAMAPSQEVPVKGADERTPEGSQEAKPQPEPKEKGADLGLFEEKPLPHSIRDTRAEILDDASWVFEALLSADRDEAAIELQQALASAYPDAPRAYASFVERALRAKKYAIAAEIADVGMSVLDEKGKRRLARLQAKITDSAGK